MSATPVLDRVSYRHARHNAQNNWRREHKNPGENQQQLSTSKPVRVDADKPGAKSFSYRDIKTVSLVRPSCRIPSMPWRSNIAFGGNAQCRKLRSSSVIQDDAQKADIDQPPARRKIGIAFRHRPQSAQVEHLDPGKHKYRPNRVDREGMPPSRFNRSATRNVSLLPYGRLVKIVSRDAAVAQD